ncbi:hypothetical protein [Clostridium estertheticum]|uniref:hypothetical protein n=1 Tax=Clostridium estertheticum TaxID=238834 RepID=UPI001C0DC534|nr:hypothetical protein [Clostridium estertheticum]MBU3183379.1 hypothetical protein [Clostridium estertheticum]MBU3215610.1 hypothetical protein [Clostridium estertheticum]MCB2338928.1 hypothetical protein [Clostridium estertheticum]WAG56772.1 hypothetical protein LL033_05905 [Clostridium estertheticum]
MIKLIIAELERSVERKGTRILFMVTAVLPIVIYYIVQYQVRCGGNNGIDALDCLNYPVYFVDEFNILLVVIIGPLFFNECLTLEVDSGAYKLIAIRPFKKWKLIVSKWISSALLYLCMLFSVLLIKTILGFLFMPKVSYTSYFNISGRFDLFNALLYNIKYYFIIFMIHITILGITSLISVIVKKTLVTFMTTSGVIMGAFYFSKAFSNIIFRISSYISHVLGGNYNFSTILYIITIDFILFGTSLYIWDKNIGSSV